MAMDMHNTMAINNAETLLRRFLDALWSGESSADKLPPLMLWGAPGVGKSTLINQISGRKGAKAENESGQLVLYAIGLNQQGIPMDKIKIRWNFLKYVTIQYEQKNGTVKTREVERCKIGESLQSNAKTWLKAFGYEGKINWLSKTISLLRKANGG